MGFCIGLLGLACWFEGRLGIYCGCPKAPIPPVFNPVLGTTCGIDVVGVVLVVAWGCAVGCETQ